MSPISLMDLLAKAVILSGKDKSGKLTQPLLLEVASLSLGLETAGGVMITLIKRNTTVLAKKTPNFSMYDDKPMLSDHTIQHEAKIHM